MIHKFFLLFKGLAGELVNVLREAGQVVPDALLKFGTHVKKKVSIPFFFIYSSLFSSHNNCCVRLLLCFIETFSNTHHTLVCLHLQFWIHEIVHMLSLILIFYGSFQQESKLYGAHFREITADAPKSKKITFDNSDDED